MSPHLDDGVLSLGASIASASRAGRQITVLTVFGGDPQSEKPAGGWDRRGGFGTEGAAVRARRGEDEAACGVVGAEPRWLSFSEADYGPRDERAIGAALRESLADAPAVLVPGFPLTNPDHALVARLAVESAPSNEIVGFYAEQPYRYWARKMHSASKARSTQDGRLPGVEWRACGPALSYVRVKRRAILEYRSQVPLLGLDKDSPSRLSRVLGHETLARGEAIAWGPGR